MTSLSFIPAPSLVFTGAMLRRRRKGRSRCFPPSPDRGPAMYCRSRPRGVSAEMFVSVVRVAKT